MKVDIDEAVRLRVEAALGAAPIKLEATVRPIEPRGKMIGFASINFGGAITLHDFRIFNGEKGLFVTPPSVKDSTTRSGYRDTARLMGDDNELPRSRDCGVSIPLILATRSVFYKEAQQSCGELNPKRLKINLMSWCGMHMSRRLRNYRPAPPPC